MGLRRATAALITGRAEFRVSMPQIIGVSPLDGLLVLLTPLVSGCKFSGRS
jgi:hypothetical protein